MKYKISVAIFVTLMLFPLSIFSCSPYCTDLPESVPVKQCVDFTRGNQIQVLLGSKMPASWIIKDGQEGDMQHVVTVGSTVQLLENVQASVRVSADNVVIDLNGFKIESVDDPVITIDPGIKNVVIKNGSIEGNGGNAAIEIGAGARSIHVQHISILQAEKGIAFVGAAQNPVQCCKVTDCLIVKCGIAVTMEYANKSIFKHCQICDCTYKGFELINSKYNKFKECIVIGIGPATATTQAVGFSAVGGKDNLFYECMAEGIKKPASDWCTKAMGFLFGCNNNNMPETESKIINCFVDSINGSDFGNAFGISLDMKLLDGVIQVASQELTDDNIAAIDWSPQCQYIAVGSSSDNTLTVLQFNGVSVGIIFQEDLSVNDLKFSSDGQFLAVTERSGRLLVYRVANFALLVDLNLGQQETFLSVDWLHWGRTLIIGRDFNAGVTIEKYLFNGVDAVTLLKSNNINGVSGSKIDISPDDKYIALSNGGLFLYVFDVQTLNLLQTALLQEFSTSDISFNQVACCGRYYIATGVGIYEFNAQISVLTSLQVFFDQNLENVIWSPDGKSVAFAFKDRVDIHAFNPQSSPVISVNPVLTHNFSSIIDQTEIDWCLCGKYLAVAGVTGRDSSDVEILQVGNAVAQCVVQKNRIANVKGGLCGIGIIGSGCCNMIDANHLYGSCVNASEGVFNTFCDYRYGNTGHKPQPLENLSFNNATC